MHTPLEQIIELVEAEYERMAEDYEQDQEYTSLDGNGCNSAEAFSAYAPIVHRIRLIVEGLT